MITNNDDGTTRETKKRNTKTEMYGLGAIYRDMRAIAGQRKMKTMTELVG